MKPLSIIKKGKRFEKWVNQQIEAMGFGRAVRTPGSGSGKLKGDSFNNLPFLLECKNHSYKNLKWWDSIEQARRQAEQGNWDKNKWALIVADNHYPEFQAVYAVIDFHEFLELLKKNSEPVIKEPDRETAYLIKIVRENLRRLLNQLE